MIKIRHAAQRGLTKTSWLDSRHTFSFNRYYNPEYSGFGDLLVINEDIVEPGQGFGTHSHDNMEILSYVLEGALEHQDSTGARGILRPNELQRMTAGTGVRHSEFNPSRTDKTHFLQIWILPEREGLKPEYEQRAFPENGKLGRLRLIGSPDGSEGSVTIHQSLRLYDAALRAGERVEHRLSSGRHAWVQLLQGAVAINGTPLGPSDGAALSGEAVVEIRASDESQLLLFDLA